MKLNAPGRLPMPALVPRGGTPPKVMPKGPALNKAALLAKVKGC